MRAQSPSHVQLFTTPWTVAHQAPLSMEFSRQEYWSGLSFPSPRGSSQPRDQAHISSVFCISRRILYHSATWEAHQDSYHLAKLLQPWLKFIVVKEYKLKSAEEKDV